MFIFKSLEYVKLNEFLYCSFSFLVLQEGVLILSIYFYSFSLSSNHTSANPSANPRILLGQIINKIKALCSTGAHHPMNLVGTMKTILAEPKIPLNRKGIFCVWM